MPYPQFSPNEPAQFTLRRHGYAPIENIDAFARFSSGLAIGHGPHSYCNGGVHWTSEQVALQPDTKKGAYGAWRH